MEEVRWYKLLDKTDRYLKQRNLFKQRRAKRTLFVEVMRDGWYGPSFWFELKKVDSIITIYAFKRKKGIKSLKECNFKNESIFKYIKKIRNPYFSEILGFKNQKLFITYNSISAIEHKNLKGKGKDIELPIRNSPLKFSVEYNMDISKILNIDYLFYIEKYYGLIWMIDDGQLMIYDGPADTIYEPSAYFKSISPD